MMKKIGKLILMSIVLLFMLIPTEKASAKEAPFYYSDKTKEKYQQEESILIAKDTDFSSYHASEACQNVKEIQFEEGTDTLGQYVFFYFPNVERIILSGSLKEINYAFRPYVNYSIDSSEKTYCLKKLKSIEVDKENPDFTSIEDALYTKDESTLICYPSAKEETGYVMPSYVKYIEPDAFGYNTNLTEIVFGAGFDAKYGLDMKYYGYLPNLTTYKVDESNYYLSVQDGILYNYDQTVLLSVPYGREYDQLILPDTVTELGNGCVSYAKIDEMILSKDLKIGSWDVAIFQDNQIASFTVNDNKYLSVVDGVLYDKEEKTLICWPERKIPEDLKFPSTLETIPLTIPHKEMAKRLIVPRDCTLVNLNWRSENSLETIEVEEGNKSFTVQDGILYSKSKNCVYLLPGKSKVTTITVPKKFMFSDLDYESTMPSVKKIIIDGDGINFPYYLFPNAKQFVVKSGNKKVKVKDQVVYSADMKTLIYYPVFKKNKSFTVPSSVINLNAHAFYGQHHLETVTLSKNMKQGDYGTIQYWFNDCTALKSIKTAAKSKYLCAVDGVLYNKNKTMLICYPKEKKTKTFKTPDSVEMFYVRDGNAYVTSLQLGSKFSGFNYCCDYDEWHLVNYPKLAKITVSTKNKEYVVSDNALYFKELEYLELEVYPMARKDSTYTFAENVIVGINDWSKYTRLKTIKSLNQYVMIFDRWVSDYTYSD